MPTSSFTLEAVLQGRGITHRFISDKANGGDATVVRPSNWNDDHNIRGIFLLSKKTTADTPDDEFNATTLNPKWTAVAGSIGTINYLEGGNVAKYDFTTRPGWMLVQVGTAATQQVLLRQDFTLPDGASIVCAISPAIHWAAVTGDELQIGLSLNSDDSGFTAGASNYQFYAAEVDTVPDIQTGVLGNNGGQGTVTVAAATTNAMAQTVFLRISRAGAFYHPAFSYDGMAWNPIGGTSFASPFNNLWFFARNAGATGTPVPVQAVAWIRQGTNTVDPWPW